MKIKLSKSQWEAVGKKAGWINKTAMATFAIQNKNKPDEWLCGKCGNHVILDEGQWLGEKEGKGGVILVTQGKCIECNEYNRLPKPIELTGN